MKFAAPPWVGFFITVQRCLHSRLAPVVILPLATFEDRRSAFEALPQAEGWRPSMRTSRNSPCRHPVGSGNEGGCNSLMTTASAKPFKSSRSPLHLRRSGGMTAFPAAVVALTFRREVIRDTLAVGLAG
jgi:hypothetical protein